jgi:spore cortex formation protein SpoVR/YcgB (stage V sporulation)
MTRLHETGQLTDGAFLEFLQSHTNVILQPRYDEPHYSGFNPYALGFGIMQDMARICTDPTEEDRAWFPDFAGKGDVMGVLKDAWANYRDESFIAQFLSPRLIRHWRLFQVLDREGAPELEVAAIHDERGYRRIRRALARDYDLGRQEPDIQIVDVDLAGDRALVLEHAVAEGMLLDPAETRLVMQSLADLWGYEVRLVELDAGDRKQLKTHVLKPRTDPA